MSEKTDFLISDLVPLQKSWKKSKLYTNVWWKRNWNDEMHACERIELESIYSYVFE